MTTPRIEKTTDTQKLHFALVFMNREILKLKKHHRFVMKELKKKKSMFNMRDRYKIEDGINSLEYGVKILKKYK